MNKFTGNYEPSLTGLTPLQASTTEETTTKSHHLSVIAISNCFFLNIWVEDPYFPTNYIFCITSFFRRQFLYFCCITTKYRIYVYRKRP